MSFIHTLFARLIKEDVNLLIEDNYAQLLKAADVHLGEFKVFFDHQSLRALRPNILITMGGDGTILKAINLVRDSFMDSDNIYWIGYWFSLSSDCIRKSWHKCSC